MKAKEIQEINQHVKDALEQWGNILLTADADNWSYYMDFTDEDVLNAVNIFNSIISNVGIKRGNITEMNAVSFGNRIHKLVLDMSGTNTFLNKDKENGQTKEDNNRAN